MASSIHNGWKWDPSNSRLDFYYRGTRVGHINSTGMTNALTLTATDSITSSKTGSAFIAATGNVAIGNPPAFATTQPQGAVIMGGTSRSGIAPVGSIATSGAVFASDTVVMKIIAAGTATNVET